MGSQKRINEKLKCWSVESKNTTPQRVVFDELDNMLDYLEEEIDSSHPEEIHEFKIKTEYFTEEELKNMPEYDG